MAKIYVDIVDNDAIHECHSLGVYRIPRAFSPFNIYLPEVELLNDLRNYGVELNFEFINKYQEAVESSYAQYVPEDCSVFVNMEVR